jgi:uncharacterized protein (DUF1697 family)
MPRYVAFLRGVSPMNAKMPDVKKAFEGAGFEDVRTLLSSGNVVFDARKAKEATLARRAEAAMKEHLGKSFMAFVRSIDHLRALLDADPFAALRVAPDAKRIVTFLHAPPAKDPDYPITLPGAHILGRRGTEVVSAYVPSDQGPVFMTLLEKTFGKDITTRTWDTVKKASA